MPKENDNTANQNPEGGAQDAANQNAQGSAEQPANQKAQGGAEEQGLKAGLVAEQKKRQEAEASLAKMQQEFDTLKAEREFEKTQAAILKSGENTSQPQKGLYNAIVERLGFADEPYLTTEQNAMVMNQMLQVLSIQQNIQNFINTHQDYSDVVGKPNPDGTFKYAAPLQRALTRNPQIGPAIFSNPQWPIIAYELAVNDVEYQKQLQAKEDPVKMAAADARALAEAATRPSSISSASTGAGTLDKKTMLENLNWDEFANYKEKIKAGY